MPGETPGPSPEEAALAKVSVPEGDDNEGKIADPEIARAAAVEQLAAHDQATSETFADTSDLKYHTKAGELRQNQAVRSARAKISRASDEVGDKAVGEFALKMGDLVKNPDEALEMAKSEDAERSVAANLEAIGSPKLAADRVEQGKQNAETTSLAYNNEAKRALNDMMQVRDGRTERAVLRGDQLKILPTYEQALAGQGATPVYEQDKGRGKRAIHESYFESSFAPGLVMVERRNARTGELISAHTMKTEQAPFEVNKKGVKLPTQGLREAMAEVRTKDLEVPESAQVINSRGPNRRYPAGVKNVGELAMLANRGLVTEVDKNSDQELIKKRQEALEAYRKQRQAQRRAAPFWQRIFGG